MGDIVKEVAGAGIDTICAEVDYTLTANVENPEMSSLAHSGTGNAMDNLLTASASHTTLRGMAGDDVLIGGLGQDPMYGGGGSDSFVFHSNDSGGLVGQSDQIMDFVCGKVKIGLTTLDANPVGAAHNLMIFLGKAKFTLWERCSLTLWQAT